MAMKTCELYWTAGFLDGEGSFSLCGGKPAKTPRIQVTQADVFGLHKLWALFGGGTVRKGQLSALSRKPLHVWVLTGPRAVAVMLSIYPLLSPTRQHQIERVLAVWRTTGTSTGEGHHGITTSDHEALEAMRRVQRGEGLTHVARSLGLDHVVLSNWLLGKARPYLLQRLGGPFVRQRVRLRGMENPNATASDAAALEAMRRVRAGETQTAVARELGISQVALSGWLRGKNRPDLLHRLNNE